MVKDHIIGASYPPFCYTFSHYHVFEVPLSFVKNGLGILLGKKHPSHYIAVIKLLHESLVLILQPRNGAGWFEKKSSAPV